MRVADASGTQNVSFVADGSGGISRTFTASGAGSGDVTISQKKRRSNITLTTCSFVVTEATTCGNGVCEAAEDCDSCTADCGVCPPICGNGVVEAGETCDPPGSCPSTCNDGNACAVDSMSGTPSTCDVVCDWSPITACASGDGCCPSGCTFAADNDCGPSTRTLLIPSTSAPAGSSIDVAVELSDGTGVGGLRGRKVSSGQCGAPDWRS